MRSGFLSIGNSLLNLAYKGTVFDNSLPPHKDDEESDNFDVVLDTAEKISILRPILAPNLLKPLITEIRRHCKIVLRHTLESFKPQVDRKLDPKTVKKKKTTSDAPSWLAKFVDTAEKETPAEEKVDDAKTLTAEEEKMPSIKRRLMRREPDFDQVKNAYVRANETRGQTIENAKTIFNTIIDVKSDSCAVSNILTHLCKFESEWTKSPKEESEVNDYAADKMAKYPNNYEFFSLFFSYSDF